MNDSISRQQAIRLYCREHCGWEPEKCPLKFEQDGTEECSVVRFLKELPSVQPEQKHGRWVKYKNWYACSECGKEMFFAGTYDESQHYCYNCGARMDGETECD